MALIDQNVAMERLMAQNVIMDGSEYHNGFNAGINRAQEVVRNLPPVQQDEKLEKCKFEYINACRIVTNPTPDTTKKDIYDAYAVIKVLQPIFGDVTF